MADEPIGLTEDEINAVLHEIAANAKRCVFCKNYPRRGDACGCENSKNTFCYGCVKCRIFVVYSSPYAGEEIFNLDKHIDAANRWNSLMASELSYNELLKGENKC